MKLNIDKCATAVMVNGFTRYTGVVTIGGQMYPNATNENLHRYLGILQVFTAIARLYTNSSWKSIIDAFGKFGGHNSSPVAK